MSNLVKRKVKYRVLAPIRELKDLVSVGPAALSDFKILGIQSVDALKDQSASSLYKKLCDLTKAQHDPCVEDVFKAAIEQAKNKNLDPEKKNWWYWSRVRKGAR